VDGLGNPLAYRLTGDEAPDVKPAYELLSGLSAERVIADKAYDADDLLKQIQMQGATAVIPPKSNRKEPGACDWAWYKERHLVECFFGKLKSYRRVFARFEKTAMSFMGFIHFISVLIWLR
jgi:transposase